MPGLLQRLSTVLAEVMSVAEEADGALTITSEGSVALVRVVAIAEDLEMVSLTQPLAWDLPLNNKIRERVAGHANRTMLGSVVLVEKAADGPATPVNGTGPKTTTRKGSTKKVADVMLRYNFPAAGLTDDALRTLILMVLETGADVRRDLTS
ncbi:hypothetical protein LTT02_30740 [Mycolicibacterium smegmatis]|uniref:hypothetical protein n=1 Tax=Mycolicibacterium smegmatis TaxID=1772 RepID=UPI0005D86659|nr:hypothetical protein [Mycolicibacterium smegmatis]MDF1902180.1 hypothetical protein [Mycolicibacterium smegmatis]MDF1909311.1 hypothetical protein [Mycolicibacterium smegmatis]MDF1921025.1 hypothetical protein [Mycolicibacterium smegmatis]MDF1922225.1 hypothetical protein [Mycolicibacterium smegmatis]UAK56135.1 hypothetical protein K8P01_05045 [Mycolicibacterium smegmatis]